MRLLTVASLFYALLLSGCLVDADNSDDSSDSDDTPSSSVSAADCTDDAICSAWLDEHNEKRDLISNGTVTDDGTDGNYPLPTAALQELAWNTQLAEVAQAHADECVFEHNDSRQSEYVAAGGENIYIGENVAVHYTNSDSRTLDEFAEDQVTLWWEEHSLWHYQAYESGTINGAGHFTQMIWANTVEIGCGITQCPNMNGSTTGYLGVCNYGPGGNYLSQFPYEVD